MLCASLGVGSVEAGEALAASGGASASGTPGQAHATNASRASSSQGAGNQPSEAAGSAVGTITVSGAGITFSTPRAGMLHSRITFSGVVSGAPAGMQVVVQRAGHQTAGRWVETVTAVTDSAGGFRAVWPANHIGRFALRVVADSASTARASARSANSWPQTAIIVYRSSIATIYGPGFWGSQTACGQILHRSTIGVANRTLPCGTEVSILYHGRTMTVPVIDRGPYANGADWDLTEATAKALGIDSTVTLGAVSLPR